MVLRLAASMMVVGLAVGVRAQTLAPQPQQQQDCSYTDDQGVRHSFDCPTGQKPATPVAPASQAAPAANPNLPANKKFPYPGSSDAPAATPGTVQQTPAPDPNLPANKRFPYPGSSAAPDSTGTPETPAPAAGSPEAQGLKDAGSSGSSSSSSSSSDDQTPVSSSTPKVPLGPDDASPDDDAARAAARNARRREAPRPKEKTGEAREMEDVMVAKEYMDQKNFQGAYMRGEDAVAIDEEDPEAHLILADAARKLGRLDEALKNYRRCLELDPIPKTKRAAQAALKEMTGG